MGECIFSIFAKGYTSKPTWEKVKGMAVQVGLYVNVQQGMAVISKSLILKGLKKTFRSLIFFLTEDKKPFIKMPSL